MKNYSAFIFSVMLAMYASSATAQMPSGLIVQFADGKTYYARLIEKTSSSIKVEFLHSHSLYTFSSDGTILQSTGNYAAGSKVNGILIIDAERDIYQEPDLSSFSARHVGVEFQDGQVYYAYVDSAGDDYLHLIFMHTASHYILKKESDGVWVVESNVGGAYPPGTIITKLFLMNSSGTMYYPAN